MFEIQGIKLAFEAGNRLEEWRTLSEFALRACDAAVNERPKLNLLTALFSETLALLFHPNIHQGLRPSPFVTDPEATKELFSHPCIKKLQPVARKTPPKASTSFKVQGRATTGTLNVLVLTDTDFDFMGSILSEWATDPSISLRARNLSKEHVNSRWWDRRKTISDRLTGRAPKPPSFLREDLAWADFIFVEWDQQLAARLSGVEFEGSLIIRLHRYEAFISTPSLTNWAGVSHLITITPYIQNILQRTVPDLFLHTHVSMVPNVIDLKPFKLPKTESAIKTLGLIQFGSTLKDPQWALDVLDILRVQDPSWRLQLIGSPFNFQHKSPEEKTYFANFDRRVRAMGDSVQQLGYREDLAETLRGVGVILSSSLIEGSPVSILQAAASGAFPVIRNWPSVKSLRAAENIYPAEWIVDTPEEGAKRILTYCSNDAKTAKMLSPSSWALNNFDSTLLLEKLNRIIFEAD